MRKVELVEKEGADYDQLAIGDYFMHECGADIYLLGEGDDGYFLMSLYSGTRWADEADDIEEVFGGDKEEFTKIEKGREIKITV